MYQTKRRARGVETIGRMVRRGKRRGAAAVEFAVAAPLLLLLVFGLIEVGQFVNIAQVVSNASREGARLAARVTTPTASSVDSGVREYLKDALDSYGISSSQIDNTSTVAVAVKANSTTLSSGTNLSAYPTGTPMTVEVTISFNDVSWLRNIVFGLMRGKTIKMTTVMRRE
jgi:Flp pilus assembly protein TadG